MKLEFCVTFGGSYHIVILCVTWASIFVSGEMEKRRPKASSQLLSSTESTFCQLIRALVLLSHIIGEVMSSSEKTVHLTTKCKCVWHWVSTQCSKDMGNDTKVNFGQISLPCWLGT